MPNAAERSDPNRARLRELHSRELSASAIARELGVSKSTISRWAKDEGLAFDRKRTADATAAKSIDLAAGRQRLAEKMLQRAEEALDSLGKPYKVFSFGGRDNTYAEHELTKPPIEVQRNALTMAGIAFDKLSRVVERDPDVTGAESAVRALQAGLDAAAAALRTPPEETPQEE
ncbi:MULTISPECIES: winged helix-turn-helix domain-containing protein [unclassified Leucobacter]|uniref:winged helix-turn-helix domain-containing protein n=1 Tax=unclassified Leucobacter TaxID=2621730 RepID=UPI00069C031B|nr:winged helix-turn-helix domain-containing protein [Leucobacter sp. Ag1]